MGSSFGMEFYVIIYIYNIYIHKGETENVNEQQKARNNQENQNSINIHGGLVHSGGIYGGLIQDEGLNSASATDSFHARDYNHFGMRFGTNLLNDRNNSKQSNHGNSLHGKQSIGGNSYHGGTITTPLGDIGRIRGNAATKGNNTPNITQYTRHYGEYENYTHYQFKNPMESVCYMYLSQYNSSKINNPSHTHKI